IERVGSKADAIYSFQSGDVQLSLQNQSVPDYMAGVKRFLSDLGDVKIDAVGFKTVLAKGYPGVHRIDADVIRGMEECLPVAPAHNRAYLDVIAVFRALMPGVPLVGSFETAFHTTIPMERRVYGIPYALTERYGLYKMGYHGASHAYVAQSLAGKRRVISCHLGGSGSICAILDGKSVDNSFGLSLQAGILHANRAGDIDPFLIPYLVDCGMPFEEVIRDLQEAGGLYGISGVSGDMRAVREAADAGNARAQLAIDVYINGIVRYIGAYFAELGGLDAIAFTGGIGENDARLRAETLRQIAHLGVEVDEEANARHAFTISAAGARVSAHVVPADEELGVATNTFNHLWGGKS
ncbi:MAG: acetate/propionate family kinase, partial [Christensenellales bacterium]